MVEVSSSAAARQVFTAKTKRQQVVDVVFFVSFVSFLADLFALLVNLDHQIGAVLEAAPILVTRNLRT